MYVELDPIASVKVDGAEVLLRAVRLGEEAGIIAKIDVAPERAGNMIVTAIRQVP